MRRVYYKYSKEKDIVERAKSLTVQVVRVVGSLKPGSVKFSLGDQVIRSSGSIGANLVEARINRSKKDFISSATIALKEANETIYWLDVLGRLEIIDKGLLDSLLSESEQIAKIVAVMVRKVKNSL